ncbi:MAG TPA: PEP-CTERM sorting domain-containing protein [Tepidisphaeraceae bacterium]|jgi:hypothetical protein|nr:PEP-CTERM sorting domain-containing protein [Tepidisphaeraceae bacterium]
MISKYFRSFAFVALVCLPVFTATASRLGHPGVSTKGATSVATQWNLISDPLYATSGSTTTSYSSPSTQVQLAQVSAIAPFTITQVNVGLNDGTFDTIKPVNGVATITGPYPGGARESGVVQVFWSLPASATPPADPTDDNTYMLTFNNVGNLNSPATFLDYMDAGQGNGGEGTTAAAGLTPMPDFYSGINGDTSFAYNANPGDPNYPSAAEGFPTYPQDADHPNAQFDTQSVTFVAGTPEPSSVLLCVVLAGGWVSRRRR